MPSGPRMHFVPRLLLRRFTNDGVLLSFYDKKDRCWRRAGVGDVGIEKNIYNSDVDRWLRDTQESPVGRILQNMLDDSSSISTEDLSIVAAFIVVQKCRVPAMRALLDDPDFLFDRLRETYDEVIKSVDPVPQELIQEREYMLEAARDDPKGLVCEFRKLDIPNAALRGGMNSTEWTIQDALMRMAWRLIRARGEEYILSDDPVIVQDSDEYDPEIVLPISRNCAVHIGIYGSEGELNDSVVCDELVRQINFRTLAGSNRFIYASQEFEWVAENAYEESFDYVPIVFDTPEVPGVKTPIIFDPEKS